MSDDEETKLDLERAMVFLEQWGSTTYPPQQWERWRYAVTEYAPEWLDHESRKGCDPDSCVTVLDFTLADPVPPRGYRIVYQYQAGEKSCPWCGDGTGEESKRKECKLCEGDGLLYWGEECVVLVLAPIDLDETLTELREILTMRDSFGHLSVAESWRFTQLFDSLDGMLSRKGSELPSEWGNHD